MKLRPDQSPNFDSAPLAGPGPAPRHPEPLPGGFEPELRAIDELLGRHASRAEAPAGLTRRVFRASVGDLPARRPGPGRESAPQPLRARRLFAASARPQWRGGLALAASLGLAFVIAALYLSGSHADATPTPSSLDEALAFDIDWQVADVDREVEYLLETAALATEADLTGELDGLFPELDL
ncbi:MAG: hypothetical protein SYC29_14245 [Planctomycetota bacterium]|nr:hypothetical protein [Planctomycetota bacterium]